MLRFYAEQGPADVSRGCLNVGGSLVTYVIRGLCGLPADELGGRKLQLQAHGVPPTPHYEGGQGETQTHCIRTWAPCAYQGAQPRRGTGGSLPVPLGSPAGPYRG